MQCPFCSHQNPEDARFCQNCGKPLPLLCGSCGTANEAQAKFCANCGANLLAGPGQPGGMPIDPLQARLQRYIPKDLLAKLAAAPAGRAATQAIGGERRVVTILFCDVEGSTALAEGLDPEDWGEIMNEAFGFLIAPVYRYEAIVGRRMGDAVLAFFSAPHADED